LLQGIHFAGVRRFGEAHAEFFNLFKRANVGRINPALGSNLTPMSGFAQQIQGAGAREIQFSLDFEF
jgi:hypothetical protein